MKKRLISCIKYVVLIAAVLCIISSCSSDTKDVSAEAERVIYDVEIAEDTENGTKESNNSVLQSGAARSDAEPSETPDVVPSETRDVVPSETPEVLPSQTPESTQPYDEPPVTFAPAPESNLPLAGYKIGIDPGHQRHGNHDKEPCAPGSDVMKSKVSSGTEGDFTHVPEYQVNLDVGLLLRDILEDMGATVIMTRTTNDVDISNIERAQLFNREKTDYALRLHCNDNDNSDVHGAFMLVPTQNPYLDDCKTAAQLLIDAYCKETGAKNLGLTYRSDQTGFNWCERMIINIEMGHMSNRQEDINLTSAEYQKKMAQGLANGILLYFRGKE